ncbi:M23 family metallopeptidase [Colwellia sp. D2M02]|uniref:M23 family metallopeptidase n=1 Tax=Colwellia sp. D2M02 TaxID=2841562 RepID=UPI001C0A370D|nr:M23 family metallopeptidase [Colwellia sp. D2M02]MBU2894976.1 M23 family metallopeptidase [Colwellia sp. D2M02]
MAKFNGLTKVAKNIAFSAYIATFSISTLSISTSAFALDNNKPSIKLAGVVEQGGLLVGKTSVGNTVTLNDKKLPLSADGDYTFGFSRDDVDSYTLAISNVNGDRVEKILTPKKREYNIQRIEGIKKSIMKPNPQAVKRSAKDSKQVKAARTISTDLTSFAGGFIAPIDGTITGVYGSQRVFNGVKKRPHFGLDYAGKIGDPVKAPAAGKVLLWVPDMFYSGGTMIIEHGHGISSTFLHLSKSYVKQGDMVEQGQVIAAVGNSGRTTGPHLDWRINWFDVKIDPALVLKIKPINTSVN